MKTKITDDCIRAGRHDPRFTMGDLCGDDWAGLCVELVRLDMITLVQRQLEAGEWKTGLLPERAAAMAAHVVNNLLSAMGVFGRRDVR